MPSLLSGQLPDLGQLGNCAGRRLIESVNHLDLDFERAHLAHAHPRAHRSSPAKAVLLAVPDPGQEHGGQSGEVVVTAAAA